MKKIQNTGKRFITLCLLLATVLSVVVACNPGKEPDVTTAPITPGGDELYVAEYLPLMDCGGYEYRILTIGSNNQTLDGDPVTIVDNGLYKRNETVKERYNIEMTQKSVQDWWDTVPLVQRMAASESADYELATLSFKDAYSEILNGDVVAACDMPSAYVDMSRPWHKQSLNDSVTIDGVPLVDFTAFDVLPGGTGMIFNKSLIEELNLADPYELIDNGTWTYDEMWKMARAAAMDLDNDPKWTENDRYGFITDMHSMTSFVYMGTGNFLINIDNGQPTLNKSEALINTLIDSVEMLGQDGMWFDVYDVWGMTGEAWSKMRELFVNDRCLFVLLGTSTLTQLGNMESDYGILPYPKKDAEQTRYYSYASGNIAMVLSCHSERDFVFIIKEALSVEALNYYYPAYYEQTIKNRYLRDEEDLKYLEVLTDSAANDLGTQIWWVEIRNPLAEEVLKFGSTNFASKLESIEPQANSLIKDLTAFVNSKKG